MVWEMVFMLLILKIPVVWISYVAWWAVKAEPEVLPGGEANDADIRPWRPAGPRRHRNGPHGSPTRAGRVRRHERAGA